MAHPQFSVGRPARPGSAGHELAQGRTFFAGAYWFFGFHEDGVKSGLRAAAAPRSRPRLRLARRPSPLAARAGGGAGVSESDPGAPQRHLRRTAAPPPALAAKTRVQPTRSTWSTSTSTRPKGSLGDSWLTSAPGRALFAFRRRDYLGRRPRCRSTKACAGWSPPASAEGPAGPIRMLTNLACLGTNFNPVSFYYCYARGRRRARGSGGRHRQHAVGRAPRLRARLRRSGRRALRVRAAEGVPRFALFRHGPAIRLEVPAAGPEAAGAHGEFRTGRQGLRRHLGPRATLYSSAPLPITR